MVDIWIKYRSLDTTVTVEYFVQGSILRNLISAEKFSGKFIVQYG
jgi:hypothetical protein